MAAEPSPEAPPAERRRPRSLSSAPVPAARGPARLLAAVLLPVTHLAIPLNSEFDCSQDRLARFPGGWPGTLDAGLYWFGLGDAPLKATGSPSAAYDPGKRTVIYFHGWTGSEEGWTSVCRRDTTACPDSACPDQAGTLLADPWIRAGWNVGFYYWDQFSDEQCVRDAEQKIWFDRGGDGLRWKSFDVLSGAGVYQELVAGGVLSVADLCARDLSAALGGHAAEGPEVRFVGHSIGTQLAVRCAAMLHSRNHPAAPHRLALLEPYFSKHHLWLFRCVGNVEETQVSTEEGVDDFAAIATTDYAKHLADTKGVVIEVYKSSVLTEMNQFGVPNVGLEQFATYVEYQPGWCGGLQGFGKLSKFDLAHLSCLHDSVFPLYFLGLAAPPPPLVPPPGPAAARPGSALAACPTPAASCATEALVQWVDRQRHVNGHQKWSQVGGADSLAVADDTFSLSPGIAEADDAADHVANELVEDPAAAQAAMAARRRGGAAGHPATQEQPNRLAVAVPLLLLVGIFYSWRSNRGDPKARSGAAGNEDTSDAEECGEESLSLMASRSR